MLVISFVLNVACGGKGPIVPVVENHMNCSNCGYRTDLADCDGMMLCAVCAQDAGYSMCVICGMWSVSDDGYLCEDCNG